MEVKIKQGKEMIDATIEMVDGVMVVSPKEVKFEPKDGDVVTVKTKKDGNYICFFKCYDDYCVDSYCGLICILDGLFKEPSRICFKSELKSISPATEEEKKLFFDRLAEEGFSWDADKKELVKLKWKPKEGEIFHFPIFSDELGEFVTDYQEYYETIFMSIERGWCFKTEQECQEFCNKLNQAINQVKP